MTNKDKLLKFRAFALTCRTSIINEDAMTAEQLSLVNNKKIAECIEVVDALADSISNMAVLLDYDQEDEELVLTIQDKAKEIKAQCDSSYVNLFNEDAMTSLEREGCMARAINECVKAVNMLTDLVLEINEKFTLDFISDDNMLVIGG